MAGQPQEPSWTPAGQEQTQARSAWPPPPAFPAPPAAAQDAYGYPPPQQPAQGGYPPPPGYAGQEQGYPGQDQTFVGQDHSQWQIPGMPAAHPAQPRAKGEKGFIGSLFDFSFDSFVTPKIIKVLYVLFTIWTALVSLLIAIIGFRTGGAVAGIFVLVIIVPIYVLLTLGVYRVVLEAFMVIFRIYEETKKIGERTQSQNQV